MSFSDDVNIGTPGDWSLPHHIPPSSRTLTELKFIGVIKVARVDAWDGDFCRRDWGGACSSSAFTAGTSAVISSCMIASGPSLSWVIWFPVFCALSDESRNTTSIFLIVGWTGKSSFELSPRVITSSCFGCFQILFTSLSFLESTSLFL